MVSIFHYPNQLFRTTVAYKNKWPKRTNVSSRLYKMNYDFKAMELVHRRDKTQDHCDYHPNHDEEFQRKMIQKIGCIPPYWTSKQNISVCKSMEQLKQFSKDVFKSSFGNMATTEYVTKPCVDLKNLLYEFEETDASPEEMSLWSPQLELAADDKMFMVILGFQEPAFKEIKQVKAFGIEGLIGNVGGYVGLFLGYSIIQLPTFCMNLRKWIFPKRMVMQL